MKKQKDAPETKPEPEPKPKTLITASMASEMWKPELDRWRIIQGGDSGLFLGRYGRHPAGKVLFAADGVQYTLSSQTLRSIADLLDTHGLALAE